MSMTIVCLAPQASSGFIEAACLALRGSTAWAAFSDPFCTGQWQLQKELMCLQGPACLGCAYLGHGVQCGFAGEVLLKDGAQQVVLLVGGRVVWEAALSAVPHGLRDHLQGDHTSGGSLISLARGAAP